MAETAAWTESHHAWAMRPATSESVLGNFNDVIFEHLGQKSRFHTRDGRFFVTTAGPTGEPADYEVKYTVGVTPLQQYLVEMGGGRLQAFSLAWDVARERWFHLRPNEKISSDSAFHWTGVYQNWNAQCASCHSTNFVKGYEPQSKTYESRWTESNVACEACHGPGEAHVTWARSGDSYDAQPEIGVDSKGLTVDLAGPNVDRDIKLCASCHSRRRPLFPDSNAPGALFLDDFAPDLLREGLYHADGQIREEVFVYASYVQSRMYANGVSCGDCHEYHGLGTRAAGNAICTRCHSDEGDPRFPSLKRRAYDTAAHHFHAPESAGGQCVGCHMPAQTYMVIDPRRDHSFRVPRPDLSVKLGTPNACTMCHADKNDAWAAERVGTWYPDGRTGQAHYAEAIGAGRAGAGEAPAKLTALIRDSGETAIVRATALDLLRRFGQRYAIGLDDQLTSKDPLVRLAAVRLQVLFPPAEQVRVLVPLLKDHLRAVRIEAARRLAGLPIEGLRGEARKSAESAFREYRISLLATADFPETQMNIAALGYRMGNWRATFAALETALRMDPYLTEAWLNLAELQASQDRREQAKTTLHKGLAKLPESGRIHNALGLLLAEEQQFGEAVEALKRAAGFMPEDARVRYNLGLALERLGRLEEARAALTEALELAPEEPDIIYGLGVHHLNAEMLDDAEIQAQRLIKLFPSLPRGRKLLRVIERRRKEIN